MISRWQIFTFSIVVLLSAKILSLQLQHSNACKCLINDFYCVIVTSCDNSTIIKSKLVLLNISIINDETTHCGKSNRISEHQKYPKLHRMVYHNVLESIADVMLFWHRYHGVIIADSFSGIDENALKYLKTRGIDMKIISGDDMEGTKIIFENPDYENFIVISNPINTKEILIAANESSLFNGLQTWIIVAHQMPLILNSIRISPQTFVTLFVPYWKADKLFKDLLSSEYETLTNYNQSQHSQPHYVQCQGTAEQNGVNIVLSTESKFALAYSSAIRVNIFDVFYGHTNNKTEALQFGTWHENKGMFMFEILNQEDREQRVRGRMIRAITFEHKPYTVVTKVNGKMLVDGYLKELMDMLLETLNIRYTIWEAPPVFGIGTNGTYTGIVGKLNRKEAEIALNVFAMTSSRWEGIRYSGPITKGHLVICYDHLEAIMPPTAYLLSFELPVWILTLISAIVIGILIMVAMVTSPGSYWTITPSKAVHSNAYRILSGTVLEEALENPPGIPSKIMFGTLLLTTMLVFIHYTSVLTSFLTSLDAPVPFKDLEGVVTNKEYAILYAKSTRHQDAFQYAEDGLFADVWKKIKSDKNTIAVKDFEEGLKLIFKGKYAYLMDGPTLYYLAADNCKVTFAPPKYLQELFYSISRLDFPYSRLLAMSLMRTMEGGILQRMGEVYKINRKPECKVEITSLSLGLNQVAAVFLVWVCGTALAMLVFCCEITVFKKYAETPVKSNLN